MSETRTISQLSHDVSALLGAEVTENNRFKSMDLCEEIIRVCDITRDDLMRETMRSWIGRIQDRFQGSHIG